MTSCPDWYEFPDDPIRSDFRNLLYLVWEHLNLPDPTPAQYEYAYFMQHGFPGYYELADGRFVKRYDAEWDALTQAQRETAVRLDDPRSTGRADILEAFRGVGKSYVAAAFSLWLLLRDPVNTKILVASASGGKAKEFVTQCKAILGTMDLFAHLRPGMPGWTDASRDQADRFDVAGHSLSQAPSLKAAGITGQITGSRATHIIADDIETKDNAFTEDAREKILKGVNEFDAILLPGPDSQVLFLGTPQTEQSIYNRLIKERGFMCFCWPARYPRAEKRDSYRIQRDTGEMYDILAPTLRIVDRRPELQWKPTDTRFGEAELNARAAKGMSFFMLQYMLDTSLSDAERYPLKQFDLIVMSVNKDKAPITIQWGRHSDRKNVLEIPNVGFSGDYMVGPLFVDAEWRNYQTSVLYVDPSGRGKDETAWTIAKALHGVIYVPCVRGLSADPATAMERIAKDALYYGVNEIRVEPNYGGLIWINAFQPILAKVWNTTLIEKKVLGDRQGFVALRGEGAPVSVYEAEWAKGMKEARIIDTLEPVMTQHRLVFDESVARDQTLMYQLTHIAKERNCLGHDDRIDSVAGAVSHLQSDMLIDNQQSAQAQRGEELDAMLEDFVETCLISQATGIRRGRHSFRGRVYDPNKEEV